ncbi:MAG: RNA methyltransferase [Vicinamibacterales bacterium]
MHVLPVVDPHDPRVGAYGSLSDAVLLREQGFFVAEGRLVVERLVTDGRYAVESLLLNAASLEALRPLLDANLPNATVFLCETSAFEAITGFNLHRGCLALVHRPGAIDWRAAVGVSNLVVVLENVTNADNVGSVFRNAAAFGVGAVLSSPTCCDPLYRKAIRTSMGASLRVPFARVEPWPNALGDLRAEGFTIVALSPREPSMTLDAFVAEKRTARVALLLGTEGDGLTRVAESIADVRVRIPTTANVDSLNLAVATGIALSRLAST